MQALHRWRNFVQSNNSLIQSLTSISSSSSNFAWFHSTPICYENWKNKGNFDADRGQPPPSKPSKKAIRFEVRQKRSDAKRALNKLLFNHGCTNSSGPSRFTIEKAIRFEVRQKRSDAKRDLNKLLFNHGCTNSSGPSRFTIEGPSDEDEEYGEDYSVRSNKKSHSKYSSKHNSKAQRKRKKRKLRRDYDDCDDDHYDPMSFDGLKNRCFWKKTWEESYNHQKSAAGSEWRQNQKTNTKRYNNNYNTQWNYTSGTNNNVESSCSIGSYTQRTLLGLPNNGPIKLDDVKAAFRSTALKWHPDKHQGPQQAVAEEKFKHCVDAYKSICNMLPKV